MSDQPESSVLHRLNLIYRQNNRILEQFERFSDDLLSAKVRLTAIEAGPAELNSRVDRLEMRVDRIERRLDIVEAPAT